MAEEQENGKDEIEDKPELSDSEMIEIMEKGAKHQRYYDEDRLEQIIFPLYATTRQRELLGIYADNISSLSNTGPLQAAEEETSKRYSTLRSAIDDLDLDATNKSSLLKELDALEEAASDETQQKLVLQRLEFETKIAERQQRSRAWFIQQVLDRRMVASFVGGILLFILVLALLIAAFLGKTEMSIVENAFLIILGYFFGQVASGGVSIPGGKKADSDPN